MNQGALEQIPLGVEQAFGDLQARIMEDVIRRISINGSVTRSADWEITRLRQLGQSNQEIKTAIQKALNLLDEAIDAIYAEAVLAEYTRNADLYKAVGNTLPSFGDNVELQNLIDAVKTQTKGELLNITRSLGFVVQDGTGLKALDITKFYQQTLDHAIGDITTGAFDYNTVLKRTVKQMTNSGLRWIDYDSGYHNRVTVAARRAVMTGFNQTVGHINDTTAKDLGTNTFEVSWHMGARPEHMTWQGRVYTKQQLIDECGLGSGGGLLGWNCYHSYVAYVLGASVRTYTDEQLDKMNAAELKTKTFNGKEYNTYEALQRQRQLETNMRAQRQEIVLLKQGGADPLDIQMAMSRYRGSSAEYVGLSKAMDLPQQRERVNIGKLGAITEREVLNVEVPKLNKIQTKYYVAGQDIAESTSVEFEGQRALTRYLSNYDPDLLEAMANETQTVPEAWVWGGYHGRKPEYRTAYRYGELPKSGRSTNWADNTRENGVSMIGFEDTSSIYDVTLGGQDIPKIKVEGWYLGDSGADGEPILVDCKKIAVKKNDKWVNV